MHPNPRSDHSQSELKAEQEGGWVENQIYSKALPSRQPFHSAALETNLFVWICQLAYLWAICV